MYGYITDNYKQYDVVEIPVGNIATVASTLTKLDATSWKARLEEFEEQECYEDAYVLTQTNGELSLDHLIPEELRSAVRFLCSTQGCLGQTKNLITVDEAKLLQAVIESRLAEYPTSVDEDEQALLETQPASATLPLGVSKKRLKMAIEVRKGEKEILMAVIALCKIRIDLSTRGTPKRTLQREALSSSNQHSKKAKSKR